MVRLHNKIWFLDLLFNWILDFQRSFSRKTCSKFNFFAQNRSITCWDTLYIGLKGLKKSGRHFFSPSSSQWKGNHEDSNCSTGAKFGTWNFCLGFYCVEGEIRKWANWAFFVVCPPVFLCWATVCTWTLLPFTKVSIELRNLRKKSCWNLASRKTKLWNVCKTSHIQ